MMLGEQESEEDDWVGDSTAACIGWILDGEEGVVVGGELLVVLAEVVSPLGVESPPGEKEPPEQRSEEAGLG